MPQRQTAAPSKVDVNRLYPAKIRKTNTGVKS